MGGKCIIVSKKILVLWVNTRRFFFLRLFFVVYYLALSKYDSFVFCFFCFSPRLLFLFLLLPCLFFSVFFSSLFNVYYLAYFFSVYFCSSLFYVYYLAFFFSVSFLLYSISYLAFRSLRLGPLGCSGRCYRLHYLAWPLFDRDRGYLLWTWMAWLCFSGVLPPCMCARVLRILSFWFDVLLAMLSFESFFFSSVGLSYFIDVFSPSLYFFPFVLLRLGLSSTILFCLNYSVFFSFIVWFIIF